MFSCTSCHREYFDKPELCACGGWRFYCPEWEKNEEPPEPTWLDDGIAELDEDYEFGKAGEYVFDGRSEDDETL
jgi:hypothetical protein